MSSTTTPSTEKRRKRRSKGTPTSAGVLVGFRRKFIITNMAFALIVLASVIVVVSYANYSQRVEEVQQALDFRVEAIQDQQQHSEPRQLQIPDNADSSQDSSAGAPSRPDNRRESSDDQVVATSSYMVKASGEAVLLEDALGLDDDTLSSAVSEVKTQVASSQEEVTSGRISSLNLYFAAKWTDSGDVAVSFASGNYVDAAVGSLAFPFALAGLAALVAFLLLSFFLSGWAVGPVERAWRQQQQFIADASHELKTPLTVIIANDAILSAMPDEKIGDQKKWIESTDTEAHLMQGLVNDMLYLAQMEGGRREEVGGTVDLSDLVESVSLQFDSVAFERGVMLEDEVEPGLQIEGDAVRLKRMVGTLVDNACKYTEVGETADVKLRREGSACVLAVHNTGKPIDPEDLPHLFDRFYRADKARTSGKGGYGLGLAIAKSIVEDHGGTIAVASTPVAGTTFTVTLPLA